VHVCGASVRSNRHAPLLALVALCFVVRGLARRRYAPCNDVARGIATREKEEDGLSAVLLI